MPSFLDQHLGLFYIVLDSTALSANRLYKQFLGGGGAEGGGSRTLSSLYSSIPFSFGRSTGKKNLDPSVGKVDAVLADGVLQRLLEGRCLLPEDPGQEEREKKQDVSLQSFLKVFCTPTIERTVPYEGDNFAHSKMDIFSLIFKTSLKMIGIFYVNTEQGYI